MKVRLDVREKQTFNEAAELAGLALSAWVRERLRQMARKELEDAGREPAFLEKWGSEMSKAKLTIPLLCQRPLPSHRLNPRILNLLFTAVTDGKAIGTYLEHKFRAHLEAILVSRPAIQ